MRPDLKLEFEERVLAPKRVIYIWLMGAYNQLDYCAAWQRLWNYVREENLFAPEVEHICVYHDDPKVTEQDKLRTDVCLVLPRVGKPKGEVGVKKFPGENMRYFVIKDRMKTYVPCMIQFMPSGFRKKVISWEILPVSRSI